MGRSTRHHEGAPMKREALLLLFGGLLSGAGLAADRSIAVPTKVATSWGFLTNSTAVKQSRTLGVGFWQRASGAKPGVGEVFASAMEFQLPEAAPSRLRGLRGALGFVLRGGRPEPAAVGDVPVQRQAVAMRR